VYTIGLFYLQSSGRHVAHQVAQLQAKILQRQGDIEVLKSGTGGAASHDGATDLRNWIADADVSASGMFTYCSA